MKKLLLLSLVIMPSLAHANIGETQAQSISRFGLPNYYGRHRCGWKVDDCTITAHFDWQTRLCNSIMYNRKRAFSQQEMAQLCAINQVGQIYLARSEHDYYNNTNDFIVASERGDTQDAYDLLQQYQ
jgi:hypothetical protein